MTPSKLWYAQKLATLRNDGSKPEDLAEQMTIRRLCYEIEKLEDEAAAEAEAETKEEPEPEAEAKDPPAPPNKEKMKNKKVKSFWSRIILESSSSESDSDLEEKDSK